MIERLTKDEYDRLMKVWYINGFENKHRETEDKDLFDKLIRLQAQAVQDDLDRADLGGGK
jgi:hypothetical protein